MAQPTFLFDLDGCLVDSVVPITTCINHGLAASGLPPRPVEELRRYIGPPLQDTFVHLLGQAEADADLVARCVDAYRAVYPEESLRTTLVVDGIPEVLQSLRDAGIRLGVVTSKPWPFAVPLIQGVGLDRHFDVIHGPEADERAEAKAETLARALRELAVDDPAAATMIGDRHHDIDAGRACGTRTVGVTWGIGDRAELEAAGADLVVDQPRDLLYALSRARSAS